VYGDIHIGAKYHKANDTVRVILRDGSIKRLSTPSSVAELSDEGQEMCQYVSEVGCLSLYCNQFPLFCFKSSCLYMYESRIVMFQFTFAFRVGIEMPSAQAG